MSDPDLQRKDRCMDVNPTVRRPLTLDALPSIRKAAATNATRASALSLIHAGLFNLVLFAVVWRGWELIERVSRPGTDLLLLAYGPALLGVGMLLLGAIGRFCPGSAPIALDALAIFVVGTWNILFQFFLEEALRPHGLRLASFTPMWLVLGAMQLKTAVLTA
ncbi:MAG: hypothetical protein HY814_09095, partial [Candidatus Riflebacteria bacterium]|nr:hypothetical protein [Candidatus Riflebacteria bacterium]